MLVDDGQPSVGLEGSKGRHRDDQRQAASAQLALFAVPTG